MQAGLRSGGFARKLEPNQTCAYVWKVLFFTTRHCGSYQDATCFFVIPEKVGIHPKTSMRLTPAQIDTIKSTAPYVLVSDPIRGILDVSSEYNRLV